MQSNVNDLPAWESSKLCRDTTKDFPYSIMQTMLLPGAHEYATEETTSRYTHVMSSSVRPFAFMTSEYCSIEISSRNSFSPANVYCTIVHANDIEHTNAHAQNLGHTCAMSTDHDT